jgi:hypothetical protein
LRSVDSDSGSQISDVSDEHVPALSATSGPYRVDSIHRVRVTGYHPLDGILQCSMKESILGQKWLRVDDVNVGEMVKVNTPYLGLTLCYTNGPPAFC